MIKFYDNPWKFLPLCSGGALLTWISWLLNDWHLISAWFWWNLLLTTLVWWCNSCNSSDLPYTWTSAPLFPWVIRADALWSDIYIPYNLRNGAHRALTFHFIKFSVHLTVPLRHRAMCERMRVDDELNMAGLSIDFMGQRTHYRIPTSHPLTSPPLWQWMDVLDWKRQTPSTTWYS